MRRDQTLGTVPACRREAGGIVTGWLFQLVVFMAVVAFVGYEVVSVAITAVRLDGTAREVAVAGANGYGRGQDIESAEETATEEATRQGAELRELTIDANQVVVEVSKQAPTLFLHNIGLTEGFTNPTARGRARWR